LFNKMNSDWFDLSSEKWALYPPAPHKYAVSTYGRVYLILKHKMAEVHLRRQYHLTQLVVRMGANSTKRVCQIMGETFPIPRLEGETMIHHADGDTTNVFLSNLAWRVPTVHSSRHEQKWHRWLPAPRPEPFVLPATHVPCVPTGVVSDTPMLRYDTTGPLPVLTSTDGHLVAYLGKFSSDAQAQRVMARIRSVLAQEEDDAGTISDFDMDTFHHDDDVSLY
jgi:hypothetical protein